MPGGWEWLIIIGVLVLLFGAKRLPEMARSVGQSARVFKGEMKGLRDDEGRTAPQQHTAPQQQARTAELPPANVQQYSGQQINGQRYSDPVDGTAGQQAAEPVRPDADR
jgi:sec-independent protein translocase protein TatA